MRFVRLLWITTRPGRAWVGSVSNKHNPSKKSGLGACISSRISKVIHVKNDHQINYNCFNEPFAVSPYRSLYWDMHGLIFETSIWLLAGSTRFMDVTLSCSSTHWTAPLGDTTTMTKQRCHHSLSLNTKPQWVTDINTPCTNVLSLKPSSTAHWILCDSNKDTWNRELTAWHQAEQKPTTPIHSVWVPSLGCCKRCCFTSNVYTQWVSEPNHNVSALRVWISFKFSTLLA